MKFDPRTMKPRTFHELKIVATEGAEPEDAPFDYDEWVAAESKQKPEKIDVKSDCR